MGADAPMLRSRQRGHRTCHHPWCGPDEDRPRRERHDEAVGVEVQREVHDEWERAVEHVMEEGGAG